MPCLSSPDEMIGMIRMNDQKRLIGLRSGAEYTPDNKEARSNYQDPGGRNRKPPEEGPAGQPWHIRMSGNITVKGD